MDFYGLVDASTPGIALVEWADLFPDEMPDDAIRVRIARVPGDDGARTIEMER